MKIFIVTNCIDDWKNINFKGTWTWYPEYWERQGHEIIYVYRKKWLNYIRLFKTHKPEIVISIGKEAGLITAIHKKITKSKIPFIFIFNDHPFFYKSKIRLKFILKNHDKIFTSSKDMFEKYKCDELIPFGSFLIETKEVPKRLIKEEIYDCGYAGQIHGFYNIEKLKEELKKENISFNIISDLPKKEQVIEELSKCKICIFPISWDASGKTYDYSLLKKPVVAIKPNLLENVGYPALYTENIVNGIKELLENKKLRDELGQKNKEWFDKNATTPSEQADIYIKLFEKYIKLFSTNKD